MTDTRIELVRKKMDKNQRFSALLDQLDLHGMADTDAKEDGFRMPYTTTPTAASAEWNASSTKDRSRR